MRRLLYNSNLVHVLPFIFSFILIFLSVLVSIIFLFKKNKRKQFFRINNFKIITTFLIAVLVFWSRITLYEPSIFKPFSMLFEIIVYSFLKNLVKSTILDLFIYSIWALFLAYLISCVVELLKNVLTRDYWINKQALTNSKNFNPVLVSILNLIITLVLLLITFFVFIMPGWLIGYAFLSLDPDKNLLLSLIPTGLLSLAFTTIFFIFSIKIGFSYKLLTTRFKKIIKTISHDLAFWIVVLFMVYSPLYQFNTNKSFFNLHNPIALTTLLAFIIGTLLGISILVLFNHFSRLSRFKTGVKILFYTWVVLYVFSNILFLLISSTR